MNINKMTGDSKTVGRRAARRLNILGRASAYYSVRRELFVPVKRTCSQSSMFETTSNQRTDQTPHLFRQNVQFLWAFILILF